MGAAVFFMRNVEMGRLVDRTPGVGGDALPLSLVGGVRFPALARPCVLREK